MGASTWRMTSSLFVWRASTTARVDAALDALVKSMGWSTGRPIAAAFLSSSVGLDARSGFQPESIPVRTRPPGLHYALQSIEEEGPGRPAHARRAHASIRADPARRGPGHGPHDVGPGAGLADGDCLDHAGHAGLRPARRAGATVRAPDRLVGEDRLRRHRPGAGPGRARRGRRDALPRAGAREDVRGRGQDARPAARDVQRFPPG